MTETEKHVKIVVVGDYHVGKTSLLKCFLDSECPPAPAKPNSWELSIEPQINHTIRVDGALVTLDLRDASMFDQEYTRRLRPLSYPGADAVLMVYSVDRYETFSSIDTKWEPEITHFLPGVTIFLLANKIDLRKDTQTLERLKNKNLYPITTLNGIRKAKEINATGFFECSSRTRNGVFSAFDLIVRTILQRRNQEIAKNRQRLSLLSFFSKKLHSDGASTKVSGYVWQTRGFYKKKGLVQYDFRIVMPPESVPPKIGVPVDFGSVLPVDILSQIILQLSFQDFLSFRIACKTLYHETNSEKYWKKLCNSLIHNYMTWHPKTEGTYKQLLFDNYVAVNKGFAEVLGLDLVVSIPARFCQLKTGK
eukprot:Phypoly_transcript_08172.p1 GENE.Phypoly_transcript_08172~~Phypoly_transcript_08172.p1  ORF type:complete len:364 (+),score=34.31 Phypoly_transcript_08172:80-1171(+)